MTTRRRLRLPTIPVPVIAGCFLFTACSSAPMPGSSDSGIGSQAWLSSLIEEAKDADASSEQLATLRSYELGSPIPFEVVEEAVGRTFQCFDDNGIPYFSEVVIDDAGFKGIKYGFSSVPGLTEEESRQIGQNCMFRESMYVQILYQSQPGYIEAADQAFLDARPAIVACLRDNGVTAEDDATRSELIAAVMALISSGPDPNTPGPDCLSLLPELPY